jgi:hypothetical protein
VIYVISCLLIPIIGIGLYPRIMTDSYAPREPATALTRVRNRGIGRGVGALGGGGAAGSFAGFGRWIGRPCGDGFSEHLPAVAPVFLITAVHWQAVVAHPPLKGFQRRHCFGIELNAIASIQEETQEVVMQRKARPQGSLKLQLRHRIVPVLRSQGSVPFPQDQHVMITGPWALP